MLKRLRSNVASYGLASTLLRIPYRLLDIVFRLLVLRILILPEDACAAATVVGAQDGWGFRSQDDLQRFCADNASLDLDSDFVAKAFARSDQCFGFVEHDALKAYAWYSTNAAPLRDAVTLKCSPGYVYMYKAYTAPQARRRGLYRSGVARAVLVFREQPGFKGFLSCVEVHNRASLKALKSIGFRIAGRCIVVGKRPSLIHVNDGRRKLFALRIEPRAATIVRGAAGAR